MFLMYVKEFIAPFPSQISKRYTFSDKHYLIKNESRLHQFFFPINTSVQ